MDCQTRLHRIKDEGCQPQAPTGPARGLGTKSKPLTLTLNMLKEVSAVRLFKPDTNPLQTELALIYPSKSTSSTREFNIDENLYLAHLSHKDYN
ncbi:hypothetical protein EVAR_63748_1 [Eumeta japonica]|uniref:Uncharacterized protein n=1 Tax=Eumeta variegata TaxID=151549 RepID=A0A4C1ZS23_EUMVA|nr:hypothetical protein EVAR_63748_1 [Eumeta japonica]